MNTLFIDCVLNNKTTPATTTMSTTTTTTTTTTKELGRTWGLWRFGQRVFPEHGPARTDLGHRISCIPLSYTSVPLSYRRREHGQCLGPSTSTSPSSRDGNPIYKKTRKNIIYRVLNLYYAAFGVKKHGFYCRWLLKTGENRQNGDFWKIILADLRQVVA